MILHAVTDSGFIPGRIVSLVPSQTELLHYLGLEEETVGITKFCVHPRTWFATKTRVGGTKTVNKEMIDRLEPGLIIANKEENIREQVEALAADHPVWVTDVNNLEDALQMIRDIGQLTGRKEKAGTLINEISHGFSTLENATMNSQKRAAYLIWKDPYMAAASGTFIDDMLGRCGFENVFAGKSRYPEITVSQLQLANCELLLLSSEPYPFKQKHIDELQVQLPHTRIICTDGEMFSWYGSRLRLAPSYFKTLQTVFSK